MTRIELKEACKMIRSSLKKDLGLNARQVSVRGERMSTSDAINVVIKVPAKRSEIELVALQYESISRDPHGGILGGGNRFVHVEFADEVLGPIWEPVLGKFKDALANPDTTYRLGRAWAIRKSDTDHQEGIYIIHIGDEAGPRLACGAHHAAKVYAEMSLEES